MKKILVIEDNAGVAELIVETLKDNGYQTLIANSGNAAIDLLKSQSIDMVILDYSLPDMDGKEIILSVKKQHITLPPFIVSTGRGDEQLAVDMMKLGAYDYLIKDKTLISKLPEAVAKLEHEILRDQELRIAQQALKDSEERFRNFVEKSSDFFVKLTPGGLFCYTSPNWEKHLGYTYAQVAESDIFALIHPDDSTRLNSDLAKASKEENNHFESEYRIKDHNNDWYIHAVKGYSVSENNRMFINCIARDVTDQKLAEKKLARAVFLAEENEKKLFAEKLHEGIGPLIAAIKMSVGRIKSLKNIDEKGLELIAYSDKLVDDAMSQVRNLANELMPNVINDFGLVSAVKSHVKRLNENGERMVDLTISKNITEPEKMVQIIIYRSLTELTSHSQKYYSKGSISIEFQMEKNLLVLLYSDSGFSKKNNEDDFSADYGLKNMVNKIESIDGSVMFANQKMNIDSVRIAVPVFQ
jgi:PAS domain S-box-containing protein